MRVEKDFEDILRCFNSNSVRYCLIGAFALAYHARPRYTKDIDLLVDASEENAERVLKALSDFGFSSIGLTIDDLKKTGQVIQLGYEPLRIDILTSIAGLPFSEVWETKVQAKYGEVDANFISFDNLIRAKRIAGRSQDIADIEVLEKMRRQ